MHAILSALGLIGSGFVVFAYLADQRGWLASSGWRHALLNFAGATLILVSLAESWNLPAAVVELFWAAISLSSLLRHVARRRSA